MKQTRVIAIIVWILTLLFAYTGFSKLLSLRQFETVLWQAPLIGNHAPVVARTVPVAELLLAVALVVPVLQKMALYTALAVLIVFTIYLVFMLTVSTRLPCQCGGVISEMSWQTHVVFNLIFIGLTVYALRGNGHLHNNPRFQPNVHK